MKKWRRAQSRRLETRSRTSSRHSLRGHAIRESRVSLSQLLFFLASLCRAKTFASREVFFLFRSAQWPRAISLASRFILLLSHLFRRLLSASVFAIHSRKRETAKCSSPRRMPLPNVFRDFTSQTKRASRRCNSPSSLFSSRQDKG